MVDDMGYSDIGCYGGEIRTPNIDSLAENGLRFTQFYNCAKCTTTRASVVTGLPPRRGKGGLLRTNMLTLGEALGSAGYRTALRQGLRMARKQAAPNLLLLPVLLLNLLLWPIRPFSIRLRWRRRRVLLLGPFSMKVPAAARNLLRLATARPPRRSSMHHRGRTPRPDRMLLDRGRR